MRARASARPRHLAIENTVMWVVAFGFYIAVAAYFVFHLHYMINDAVTRVDNAFDVLYSRDPHLAAIGFFWPPLPSFLELPILAFKGLWPPLAAQGFAGSIEAAAFSAGTVVLFNSGLKWAGVVRGMRWILCFVWMVNPMIVIFATQGMSEAPFMFFFVASILVFIRWCESRRTSLLPLAGVLAGGAALCRDEALLVAFLMGIGVIVQSVRNGARWRQIETEALLYGLPALFVIGLWLGTAAVIFHDPLYLLHANGIGAHAAAGGGGGATAAARASAYGLVQIDSWKNAATVVINHVMLIYPAAALLLALVGARLLVKQRRVSGIMLLIFGVAIPALDVYLLRGGLSLVLRYQISVIPFTFLAVVYVLRSVKGKRAIVSSWLALTLAVLLAISNIMTAQTLGNPQIAEEESPVLAALSTGQPVVPGGDYSAFNSGPQIVAQLLKLDIDNGVILCDSSTCFALNIAAPDPKLFAVTSDRNFEAAASQPHVYGVEYFLVPAPSGAGAVDHLNQLYPGLWQDGAGFAILVGEGPGGGPLQNWRLYRITGPTGRG